MAAPRSALCIRHVSVAVPADAIAHVHDDLAGAALRTTDLDVRADVTTAAELEAR